LIGRKLDDNVYFPNLKEIIVSERFQESQAAQKANFHLARDGKGLTKHEGPEVRFEVIDA